MAKEVSDLFNANRLRALWQQSGQTGGRAVVAQNTPALTAAKLPPAEGASNHSVDPTEYLRQQADRSHIPVRSPDEALRTLGHALNEVLGHDSLTLLNIWQPLQIEVAKLIPSKTKPLNTATALAKSSPDQLYKLIDQLDDAVTALLANKNRNR